MEKYTTVMIYEDPITQLKPEGEALLLRRECVIGDGLESWKVCFKGEDGGVYSRAIKVS